MLIVLIECPTQPCPYCFSSSSTLTTFGRVSLVFLFCFYVKQQDCHFKNRGSTMPQIDSVAYTQFLTKQACRGAKIQLNPFTLQCKERLWFFFPPSAWLPSWPSSIYFTYNENKLFLPVARQWGSHQRCCSCMTGSLSNQRRRSSRTFRTGNRW